MNKLQTISLATILVVVSAGVYTGVNSSEVIFESNSDTEPYTESSFYSLGEALCKFSIELYKQLIKSGDDNIFFSPYSVFVALAMTYEGARGKTAEEMMKVLNIPQNNETILNSIKQLYEFLNQDNDFNISTANALWVRENLDLLLEYSELIENYYHGHSSKIDYSDPKKAADIINDWVENQTNGKIKDLIKEKDIDPLYTALILTNAIYFKGEWKLRFDPEETEEREFELSTGEKITVPTMCMKGSEELFSYAETEELQILELLYAGEELSMLILLPKEKSVAETVESVSCGKLSEWRESLSEKEVDIYLPKFKLETEYQLKDTLIERGMVDSFSGTDADFSGIFPNKSDLYIYKVIHKAFVEVNEEGTEAAAATAVIMRDNVSVSSETRIVFDANHPFIFLIQQKETGNILFMGNVGNPLA